MQLSQLGNTGLYVSKLSLGTMTLGEAGVNSAFHGIGCPRDEAFSILDYAIESGINLIDTANVYGEDGMVERLLGDYFSLRKNRTDLILASKFRFSMGGLPHQTGGSRKHIMDAVEGSLKRLKTDYIDLYQMHMEDSNTPQEETLQALDDLIRQGKVRYIGASNYTAHRFLEAHYKSRLLGLNSYCSLQMQYHLLCREIEKEHVPACVNHNVGILVWSPLAGGFLSGKYQPQQAIDTSMRYGVKKDGLSRFDSEKNWRIVENVKEIAQQVEASPSQVALAWLLKKPGVTSLIVGARRVRQLQENIQSLSLDLSEEHMSRLDSVSALENVYPYHFIKSKQKHWA